MNIFSSWIFYLIAYLILYVIFTQEYKVATKSMVHSGSLTLLLETIGACSALLLIPFFKIQFPTDIRVYLFLGLSLLFYTINDRLGTIVREGIEASTYSVISQLSTVFMVVAGLVFFKEKFLWYRVLGTIIILFSNILVFYEKGSFKPNKYILLGILANLCLACALFIDVNLCDNFNLAFYVMISLGIPSILIKLIERIKIKEVKNEYIQGNKKAILLTGITWCLVIITNLRIYQLGEVTVVAPLCSLTLILNVIAGYFFYGEKSHLLKKVLASVFISIGVILINCF